MKIKTSELTGTALDYAVAMCEKSKLSSNGKDLFLYEHRCYMQDFMPSTDYSQGAPIIERECINLTCCYDKKTWFSTLYHPGVTDVLQRGDTLLIAAMRCYVASKLGETVEIPNELL